MLISAVVITFNEEEMIVECLKSLYWADEIIVVDCGSIDQTRQLAQKAGALVSEVKFKDFSQIRNYALNKAKGDWILYVDADEKVTTDLSHEILKSIKDTNLSAFNLKRKNYYLGKPWPYIETVTRLFLKRDFNSWKGQLHETPNFNGAVRTLGTHLFHFAHRNLSDMVEKTNRWSDIEADLRFKSGHPQMSWWRFFRVMLTSFWQYYILQGGLRAGDVGIIESLYQSYSIFITYAKLYEEQRRHDENRHL